MRLATALLLGAASLAPMAAAQTTEPAATPAPASAPQMTPTVAPMPAPAPDATVAPTTGTPEPTTTSPPVPGMTPAPAPAAVSGSVATPAVLPAAPEAPPAPPPPPTDPTAISLLKTLDTVCIPMVGGGNLAKLAKAAGYRKAGDNWNYKQPGFQFTVLPPGSNPNTCQVELVHPVDQAEPAKPLVVALHNWSVMLRGWSLDRNDKHTSDGQEFITRSWVHDADGKHEALVLTTIRKADDSPSSRNGDTSEMFYSVTKLAS